MSLLPCYSQDSLFFQKLDCSTSWCRSLSIFLEVCVFQQIWEVFSHHFIFSVPPSLFSHSGILTIRVLTQLVVSHGSFRYGSLLFSLFFSYSLDLIISIVLSSHLPGFILLPVQIAFECP